MKKFYCFNCQQEIEPKRILRWNFCPQCKRLTTDDGEGFYIVCDNCGANMPPLAKNCYNCGHGFHGYPDVEIQDNQTTFQLFIKWLFSVCLFIAGAIILLGFLHLMIYVIAAIAILTVVFYLYDLFFNNRD